MTLQTSSVNRSTKPQPQLPSSSEKTEAIIIDTPVNRQQHRREKIGREVLENLPGIEPETASPSVSAIIDALHLSDIDWGTLSFTSSPSSQASQAASDETGGVTKQPELYYAECPLDRVLIRNADKSLESTNVVSKHLNYELGISRGKQTGETSSESSSGVQILTGNKKEPLTNKTQCVLTEITTSSKEQNILLGEAQSKINEKSNQPEKPPRKYTFVKTALSSSSAPPQRGHSDPGQRYKKSSSVLHSSKKSVCMSICSSSEDSDAENQQSGARKQAKAKQANKTKNRFISDFPLKPATSKSKADAQKLQCVRLKPQSRGEQVGSETPLSTVKIREDNQTVRVSDDETLQTPASPAIMLDGQDSVICSDSPLPLAERLRLKFLK